MEGLGSMPSRRRIEAGVGERGCGDGLLPLCPFEDVPDTPRPAQAVSRWAPANHIVSIGGTPGGETPPSRTWAAAAVSLRSLKGTGFVTRVARTCQARVVAGLKGGDFSPGAVACPSQVRQLAPGENF